MLKQAQQTIPTEFFVVLLLHLPVCYLSMPLKHVYDQANRDISRSDHSKTIRKLYRYVFDYLHASDYERNTTLSSDISK